jgi:hypothetical protein
VAVITGDTVAVVSSMIATAAMTVRVTVSPSPITTFSIPAVAVVARAAAAAVPGSFATP